MDKTLVKILISTLAIFVDSAAFVSCPSANGAEHLKAKQVVAEYARRISSRGGATISELTNLLDKNGFILVEIGFDRKIGMVTLGEKTFHSRRVNPNMSVVFRNKSNDLCYIDICVDLITQAQGSIDVDPWNPRSVAGLLKHNMQVRQADQETRLMVVGIQGPFPNGFRFISVDELIEAEKHRERSETKKRGEAMGKEKVSGSAGIKPVLDRE